MSKICQISGKKFNRANQVSHSNVKTKKVQNVNLHLKKIWSVKNKKWIRVKISSKMIKSLHKIVI